MVYDLEAKAASRLGSYEKLGVAKPMPKATNMKRRTTHLSQESKKVLRFQKLGRFSIRLLGFLFAGRATSRRRRECGGVARGLVSACVQILDSSSSREVDRRAKRTRTQRARGDDIADVRMSPCWFLWPLGRAWGKATRRSGERV